MRGGGGGFIVGDGYLYIVDRWVLTPLRYEEPPPPYIAYPPLFKFCPTPSPTSLSPPTPTPTVLSVGGHSTFDLLFYLMIVWIYTCRAFVP